MRNFVLAALVVLSGGVARGYDQPMHAELSRRAYAGPTAFAAAAAGADEAAARALRERIWRAGAEASDAALASRFRARYPSFAAFDAWELKRFLALNPDKAVAGLDERALPEAREPAALYALASRWPDDDQRNCDRFRHDAARQVLRDAAGEPLPEDPATLEMGGRTGLSSQAHAHYGLPKLAFSDDPDVLKRDPRRFAVPPTVHTFGAAMADTYTALAVLAARLPGGERLALVHAGAAAHHIEDVANQIHTVQVGLYDFFVDAKLEQIKGELRTVGGLLGKRPTLVELGVDIIGNHHLLAEALFARHLLAPGDPVATAAAQATPDAAFATELGRVPDGCAPGFGGAIAEALIERSSYEGPEVYRAVRAVADGRWSRAGQHFGAGDDPDRAIRPGADLGRFYALEIAGAARSQQALAAWWQRFNACRAAPAEIERTLAERLVRDRLDALDAAETRARAFRPAAAAGKGPSYWVPLLYLAVLLAVVAVVRRRRRRR